MGDFYTYNTKMNNVGIVPNAINLSVTFIYLVSNYLLPMLLTLPYHFPSEKMEVF